MTTQPKSVPPSDRERPRPRSLRWSRSVLLAGLVLVLAVPADATSASRCWLPPVVGKVADPFRAPSCPYCAGNRGIEYRVHDTAVVRSVAAGSVSFAGVVAGTRYVVVDVGGGWRVTYGRLESSSLSTGDRVVTGMRIGTARGLVFFGLRVGERYIDPAPFLGRLVGEPRLVPTDATAARPSRSTVVRCRCRPVLACRAASVVRGRRRR